MRNLTIIALVAMMWHSTASAQTTNTALALTGSSAEGASGLVGDTGIAAPPEFAPLTTSERISLYVKSAFGPGALARAVLSGGIAQWTGTPKEWGGGSKAFGERVGNSFAQHIIFTTLESGAAAALHEDNRYVRSTESGIWRRTRHAVASTFVARNNAGREHFAYSRFGGAAGSAFISRIWQPPSKNTSGDAAINFGITIGADMGWNLFREFRPGGKRR